MLLKFYHSWLTISLQFEIEFWLVLPSVEPSAVVVLASVVFFVVVVEVSGSVVEVSGSVVVVDVVDPDVQRLSPLTQSLHSSLMDSQV